jgi:predicted DNA-binding protein with PD1-like motif
MAIDFEPYRKLIEGKVRPTLEVVLVESPAHMRKHHDRESGLALIDAIALYSNC